MHRPAELKYQMSLQDEKAGTVIIMRQKFKVKIGSRQRPVSLEIILSREA